MFPDHFLPAGTPLYGDIDGELVGETVRDRDWVAMREDAAGGTAISVSTPWGDAVVWAW